jgi:uncharacterized protein YgiM (DUF1202 family)
MNAFCTLSIVPVRSTPSDSAEMVNQLLYGERISIIETQNNWYLIESELDKYKGWVDKKQVEMTPTPFQQDFLICKPLLSFSQDLRTNYFLAGSFLPQSLLENCTFFEEDVLPLDQPIIKNKEATPYFAQQFLNAPYLWGGRSVFGMDCSGLTQIGFRLAGIHLKRDASEQATMGELITNLQDVENGDLAFFNKGTGDKVTHVGIVMKENDSLKIIHASGKVKIDDLTNAGIVDQTNTLTHHLLFYKRILF